MPFILRGRSSEYVELVHHAQASSLQVTELVHYARGGWAGYDELVHVAQAGVAEVVELVHVAVARISPAAPVPVQVIYGTIPITVRADTDVGHALSVSYSDDGSGPTATVTLPGTTPPSGDTLSLRVTTVGSGGQVGTAPDLSSYEIRTVYTAQTLDLDDQYEVKDTPGAPSVTVRGYSLAASRLGSVRLPELVSFAARPTPRPPSSAPCSSRPRPQQQSVPSVVAEAVRAAGLTLTFGPYSDPLTGEHWTEWRTPYSTRGKSPQQVLQDTYLAIGWHAIIRRVGGSTLLYVLPPGGADGQLNLSGHEVQAGGTRRRETAQLPATVTVKGADVLVDLPRLTDLIQLSPDPTSFEREVRPNMEWIENRRTADGKGETILTFHKEDGRITGTYSVTVQDVTVQEQVNGKLVTKPFGKVLTAEESTESTYHPACRDQLLRQVTRKRSWGYTVATQTSSTTVGKYGYLGGWNAGDPLGDEQETVEQGWSAEGWLQYKLSRSRKLSSTKQANPEGELRERGPLEAYEYVERVRLETYRPDGSGWVVQWWESGGQPIPIYDAESLDAVRMGVRGGSVVSGMDRMDAAPPSVTCPDPCAQRKRAVPNVVRLAVQGGREGTDVERTVTWTDNRQKLIQYGRWVAQDLARRETASRTLLIVPDLPVGTLVSPKDSRGPRGVVQASGFEIRGGGGSSSVTLRVAEPVAASPVDDLPDDPVHRDIVLFRQIGGVTVDAFTGQWNGSEPIFKRRFVAVAGTQYPTPLDELEWIDDPRYGPTATGNYGQETL
ncbi:hypothetical protein [Deinococcus soli (ex Cha et al. 2016)]|uniref:hypothetical protein n=1 Tax=Deinococcus soli (ex Cha et al. 2016) TaxID=1309411 RepID=UPI001664ECE2|nr:hypothetical protein [Deinococcus soli (ex Cha et al. 2016)]GGB64398.1 hypothetical protein GCM10008019_20600 [Deinococcus soli (ex Cha et al. 2016)]